MKTVHTAAQPSDVFRVNLHEDIDDTGRRGALADAVRTTLENQPPGPFALAVDNPADDAFLSDTHLMDCDVRQEIEREIRTQARQNVMVGSKASTRAMRPARNAV
jgi:hypothetical protein